MKTLMKDARTVLVVDDDKSILRTFTRILQKAGYTVDVAETGKEAMQKVGGTNYDVALIDVRLPDMDGTDLLQPLRKKIPNAAKIVITGFPSMDNGVKALDSGADAYLVKPLKPEELIAVIDEKIKAHQRE
jgi:DNA-binding response OmpR family regulator